MHPSKYAFNSHQFFIEAGISEVISNLLVDKSNGCFAVITNLIRSYWQFPPYISLALPSRISPCVEFLLYLSCHFFLGSFSGTIHLLLS